jgi:PAS domain S-box-containing protein
VLEQVKLPGKGTTRYSSLATAISKNASSTGLLFRSTGAPIEYWVCSYPKKFEACLSDGKTGFYADVFETTEQLLTSRRMQTLRYLGECLNATRSVKQFWSRVLDGLQESMTIYLPVCCSTYADAAYRCVDHYEVPFALLYSIAELDDSENASQNSESISLERACLLEGSIGIPDGHHSAPQHLELKGSQEGFIPGTYVPCPLLSITVTKGGAAFREAMRTREPTMLRIQDGTISEPLLEGIEWRGYGDPCREAIIFPLRPTNGDTIFAFLLIGIHPRRAYDEDYRSFAAMLNRQLATSLASVLLFENEMRRSTQLSKDLERETNRMQRMAELSPLGMYQYATNGALLNGNDRWYEMTGMSRDDCDPVSFVKLMAEGSRETSMRAWGKILEGNRVSQELQFMIPNVQPRDLSGEPIDYWVLATSQPERGPDGEILSVMGSIADISQIKWAQGLQEKRLREAEETKRQQNEFIDITSHEMRNPLSAVLMCADNIQSSLTHHTFRSEDQQAIQDCIEAAINITLCSQHQKSIVDDILTVSKLDSNLLLITPEPTRPVAVVEHAMSMLV